MLLRLAWRMPSHALYIHAAGFPHHKRNATMPPKTPKPTPPVRRYSQAFREPALTVTPGRTSNDPPTPEAFYFEKQMQQQTPLMVVLEDGEQIDGILEWYDAGSLRLRRANGSRVVVYKHAIKYLHKQNGHSPGE